MVSQELIEFIRKAVEKHYTADQITNSLLKQGWKQEEIVEALALISNTANPEPQTAISQPKKKKSSWSLKIEDESDALKTIKDVSNFFIGVFIVDIVAAVILMVAKSSNEYLIVDGIIFLITSIWLRKSKNRTSALVLLILAVLSLFDTFVNRISAGASVNLPISLISIFVAFKATKATFFLHSGEKLSKKLIATVSVIIIVGLSILILEIQPALVMSPWLHMQFYSRSKDPSLYVKPIQREININGYKPEKPVMISHFGISLNSPWGEPDAKNSKEWSATNMVYVLPGKHAININTPNPPAVISLKTMSEVDPNLDKFKMIFGNEVLSSNYKLHQTLLGINPDDLTIYSSQKQLTFMGTALPFKKTITLGTSYIYIFTYKDLKGYQIYPHTDHPNKNDNALLTIFDSKDNIYSIFITNATQQEVDYIISTIKFSAP